MPWFPPPAFQHSRNHVHTYTQFQRVHRTPVPTPNILHELQVKSLWFGWSLCCFWPLRYYCSKQDILLIANIPSDKSGRTWGWNEQLPSFSFQTSNITFSFWSISSSVLIVILTEFAAIMKSSEQLYHLFLFSLEIIISQNITSKNWSERFWGVILCWLQLRVKLMSVLCFISQLTLTSYSIFREVRYYPLCFIWNLISANSYVTRNWFYVHGHHHCLFI